MFSRRGKQTLRTPLIWLMASFLATGSALAASDLDFYERLLSRGVSHFAEGNFTASVKELRIAAFGLADVIDEFETAHVYLTIAASRLHSDTDVRGSVMRVLSAQRVQSRYAALPLPGALRQEFDRIAAGVLTGDQLAELHHPSLPVPSDLQRNPSPMPPVIAPQQVPSTDPRPVRPPQGAAPGSPSTKPATPMPMPVVKPSPSPAALPPTNPKGSSSSSSTSPSMGSKTSPKPAPRPATSPAAVPPAVRTSPPVSRSEPPSPAPSPVVKPSPAPQPSRPVEPSKVMPSPAIRPTPQPAPVPAISSPRPASDVNRAIAEGQRSLDDGDLARARESYQSALESASLSHDAALRVGEGLYRTHDFAGAVRAFQRAGSFARSEAQAQYYLAVSLYESGRYRDAKHELAAALPFIEATPDVVRYQKKIEGSLN